MSHNRTGKLCEAPICNRLARSGSATYCDTHYIRVRTNQANSLRPIKIENCLECGSPNPSVGNKFCSKLCGDRHQRNTPPEKQRGRTPPLTMVAADIRQWRIVPDFPDYEISNDGLLRRLTAGSNSKPGQMIRPTIGRGGYPHYGLTRGDGKRFHFGAHRLVATAFLPPPSPDQPFVLHKNDDRFDARDTNLRWGTPLENANDALANGRMAIGDRHPCSTQPWTRPRGDGNARSKLTEEQVREILRSPASEKSLAVQFDVSPGAIGLIRRAKNWRHITDPAYGAALIEGAANFASPPPRRKRLTTQMRFDLLKRENYRCHLCKGLIYPGQGWDISHETPIELGGADDDTNRRAAHRKCHHVHTATVDIPAIAKAKRIQAKHHAGTAGSRPMRGGRHDTLKRKMDGTVVVRATGQPVNPRNN